MQKGTPIYITALVKQVLREIFFEDDKYKHKPLNLLALAAVGFGVL